MPFRVVKEVAWIGSMFSNATKAVLLAQVFCLSSASTRAGSLELLPTLMLTLQPCMNASIFGPDL